MRNILTKYEVRVNVKNGSKRYSSFLGMYVQDEAIKMFHKDARTPKQAMMKCEKHGRPLSARKVSLDKMVGDMGNLKLDEQLVNPYENAIAMDEFVWQKRNIRIKNRGRDKKTS